MTCPELGTSTSITGGSSSAIGLSGGRAGSSPSPGRAGTDGVSSGGRIHAGGCVGSSPGGVTGASGRDGVSGFSGFSGISGVSGISGSDGSGFSGTSGVSGVSGSAGGRLSPGFSGSAGVSGLSGVSGVSGTSGTSGTAGSAGVSAVPSPPSGSSSQSGTSSAGGSGVCTGFCSSGWGISPSPARAGMVKLNVSASAKMALYIFLIFMLSSPFILFLERKSIKKNFTAL